MYAFQIVHTVFLRSHPFVESFSIHKHPWVFLKESVNHEHGTKFKQFSTLFYHIEFILSILFLSDLWIWINRKKVHANLGLENSSVFWWLKKKTIFIVWLAQTMPKIILLTIQIKWMTDHGRNKIRMESTNFMECSISL